MRLIFLFFLFLPVRFPVQATHVAQELLGQWVRIGDYYEGMQIEVISEDGQLNGRIIALPATARLGRFRIGDIKWNNIRQISGTDFHFGSLVIALDERGNIRERRYDASSLSFFSPDEIHTQTLIFRPDKSGNFQQWVRLQPI